MRAEDSGDDDSGVACATAIAGVSGTTHAMIVANRFIRVCPAAEAAGLTTITNVYGMPIRRE
jgi:hypothetical protein